ncbi:PAS-domain containing protein [Sedimenticola thiotaurini]|uniref:PAS-domain containing protein n=1 Tax=Sedimenticola thiotaurini TaxID=1543721 RepID=UPI00069A1FA0|nr:PAS-domain containing protein [Sedimenticola thiotaurini]
MPFAWLVFLVSLSYLALLFLIAYGADRRAARGQSIGANPYVYSLSLAVYATSWTYYGSVGRATTDGIGFLPIYLGPTLLFLIAPFLLRKILKIAQEQHTTSIADFISSRYGKSQKLAGLVTIVAVIGIMPYLALQLKAISTSFNTLIAYPAIISDVSNSTSVFTDKALYVTLLLALFTILFATRRLDASEHHEGLMVAIAFESLVKLVAFIAVGIFVSYAMFDGIGSIYQRVESDAELALLFSGQALFNDGSWTFLMLLSALTIFCLPRQFQVTVVENTDRSHLDTAMWLFPLYLLLINLFVLPIAVAGLVTFPSDSVNPDTFVLALPMSAEQPALALLVYLGGLSAASGMVIVAAVALSTMICNDLMVPLLMRLGLLSFRLGRTETASGILKTLRRLSILGVLILAYSYFRVIGDSYALVTIGLVSFAAAAQFAPLIIGGLFWRGATLAGALAGLASGFLVWGYTLVLPSFAQSGWLPLALLEQGPFGIGLLKPQALFGLDWENPLIHSLFWSAFFNIGCYLVVSLFTRQSSVEQLQARAFVDLHSGRDEYTDHAWRGQIKIDDLERNVARFADQDRVGRLFGSYRESEGSSRSPGMSLDAPVELLNQVEKLLSGVVGSASARALIDTGLRPNDLNLEGMLDIIEEASSAVETSREVLKSVVENIDQGISMFDRDMNLVAWNRRFVELNDLPEEMLRAGVTLQDICGFNIDRGEYGLVEEREAFIRQYIARTFRPERVVFEKVRANKRILELTRTPMKTGGVVTTYTDITRRKQAELELTRLRNLLSNIIDSMPSALIGIDVAGRITHWNREAERMSGTAAAEAVGQPFSRLIPRFPDVLQKVAQAISPPVPVQDTNLRWEDASGEVHYMDVTLYPLLTNSVEGAVIRLDDVTETVRMEEVMVQSEKMLSVGGLAAGMAHEINNPLAGIVQSIQVINSRLGSGMAKNHAVAESCGTSLEVINQYLEKRDILSLLEMVSQSGKRAARIVSSMLSFSRKSDLKFEWRDLRLLLDDTLEIASNDYNLAKHYDFRKIDIVREYADPLPEAWCEGSQIQQVLLNLLRNGAQAMFEALGDSTEDHQDRFILRVYPSGQWVCVEIEDNGPGMSDALRRRIFEPFFTTKEVGSGTGLGLSVSYFIITQNHRGSIEVKPVRQGGSCFILRLPIEPPQRA